MKKKEDVQECDVELCCKATGQLKLQVQKELAEEDKPLAELLVDLGMIIPAEDSEEDADENSDPAK